MRRTEVFSLPPAGGVQMPARDHPDSVPKYYQSLLFIRSTTHYPIGRIAEIATILYRLHDVIRQKR